MIAILNYTVPERRLLLQGATGRSQLGSSTRPGSIGAERSDSELSRRFEAVYTGAVTDVLFEMGLSRQTLKPTIGPLRRPMRLAGPAFCVETRVGPAHAEDDPSHARAWELFETVPPGSILVYADGSDDHAVIGDLAVARLKVNGCAGIVIDGGCRDVEFVVDIGLPVFCRYVTPEDLSHGHGALGDWGGSVSIGDVTVDTGDYVVADSDGVVVIPKSSVATVLERAERVVVSETRARDALLRGVPPDRAFDENDDEEGSR